jgi:hypothetical protein
MLIMDPKIVLAIAKLLGLSPLTVAHRLNELHKKGDEDFRMLRAQARKQRRGEIIERSLQNAVLALQYSDSALLEQGMFRYSFAVDGDDRISLNLATSKESMNLTVALGGKGGRYRLAPENEYTAAPKLTEEDSIRTLRNYLEEGRRIFNQPLFRLLKYQSKKTKFMIEFGLTDFVQYVTTCGFLEDELFQALIDMDLDPTKVHANSEHLMPARSRFLPDSSSLFDFKSRLCAGGLSVLLAFMRPRPDNDFVFFVKKRSKEVAAGHGLLSLVPMGYHQPLLTTDASHEVSLESTVFREVFEEVFGGSEVISQDGHLVPGWFMRARPEMKWFVDNPGHFIFETVGFAWSLLLGDYNAAILMAVLNLDYWGQFASKFAANYEHDTDHNMLVSTRDSAAISKLLRDPTFVDPGRFTLIRALKRLQKLEPSRVKLPRIDELD